MIADFLLEVIEASKQRKDMFKTFMKNNCQHRILYATKISFSNEGKIKHIQQSKLRKFAVNTHYKKHLWLNKLSRWFWNMLKLETIDSVGIWHHVQG